MRPLHAAFCFCLLLLGIPTWVQAQGAEPSAVVLKQGIQADLSGRVEYLAGHPDVSFEQVAGEQFADSWRTLDPATLDRSLKNLWLRFDIQQLAPGTQYLMLRWPVLDEVVVRLFHPHTALWSEPMRDGDTVPLSEQPVASRHLVFPLALAPEGRATVYLKVHVSEPIALPLEILDGQTLTRQEQHELALINLFFGGILVILLYNFCLFFFTRELIYLLYVAYLGSMVGYALALTGVGPLYLWPENTWLGIKLYGLAAAAAFFTSQLFARRFLDLPGHGGWPLWVNNLSLSYWGFGLLAVMVAPGIIPYIGTQLMALLSSLVGLAIPIYLWIRGNQAAKLFTLAWGSLITFTVIHLLALEGRLPLNPFTLESQLAGIFAEFVLLSIALAGRINRERHERVRAQQAALESSRQLAVERGEKLQAQQRALEIQRQANEVLEGRVRKRTQALEEAKRGLEQVNTQLERLSVTDPLTQLYNRRYFDKILQAELLGTQTTGQPLSLLMVDLDHFKQLNDGHGHPFGDECIRAVAKVLSAHTQRHGEVAARYGGEEFVALLPDTNQAAAVRVAERIRLAISELRLLHGDGAVALTASIGVACQTDNEHLCAEALFEAADAALYAAKHGGRNRVVVTGIPAAAVSAGDGQLS